MSTTNELPAAWKPFAKAEALPDAEAIESVLVNGDLARLSPAQRVSYYARVCQSLELNPLTKPFDYISLNGKLVLYAKRDATEQLRSKRGVSVVIVAREVVEDCYIVTARASLPTGRQDESIGAVPLAGLKGEARANALMKAETKAKRRVTLSICGLGLLDETEVDTITSGPSGYSVEAPTPGSVSAALPAGIPPAQRGGDAGHSTTAASSNGKTSGFGPENAGSIPAAVANYHTTQNNDPTPALPEGALTIARVDTSPTKNPNVTKAFITFSTGEQATTIKTPLITLCQELCQTAEPVTVETKATKWGLELVMAHRVAREAISRVCEVCGFPTPDCACELPF